MLIRSILACAAAAPLLIAAAQPVRLQPSSPWVVDYAENSCRLIRTFGDGKNTAKLAFESAAPGEMDMLIVGRPLSAPADEVPARFLPVGGKTFDGLVVKAVNGDPAILWSHLRMLPDSVIDSLERKQAASDKNPDIRPPPVSLAEQAYYKGQAKAFATAATELEIQTHRHQSVVLETGSLGPAMAKFDECGRNSLRDWGVDPDLEDKIVRPVWTTNPRKWLFTNDYPDALIARGKQSDVAVRLLIDASGKLTKCTSLSHFDEKEFNRITCEAITKRARFEPAELADGTKVPSYYTRRVLFRIAQ